MSVFSSFGSVLHSRRAKWSLAWLASCLFLTLTASFLANDLPLYAHVHGFSYFPALNPFQTLAAESDGSNPEKLTGQIDWKNKEGFTVWPLVTYSPASLDLQNTGYVSPGGQQHFKNANGSIVPMPVRYRHWLGTTQTGNDVLSGLIHGTRISLCIGILSMLIAGVIGLVTGMVSGYSGDKGLRVRSGVLILLLAGIIPAYFYAFYVRGEILIQALQNSIFLFLFQALVSCLLFFMILLLFYGLGRALSKIRLFSRYIHVPLDLLLSRITEVFAALPRLVLIITLSALARPSLINLVLIFGLTGWTDIARIVRAEMLKIRKSDYLQVAIGQGLPPRRIIFVHALPNIIQPVLVSILFGVSGVILAESALSFLGIGVPFDTVTWGSLIAAGRENFHAWWLVVFPGLAIFFTIWSLHVLADELRVIS